VRQEGPSLAVSQAAGRDSLAPIWPVLAVPRGGPIVPVTRRSEIAISRNSFVKSADHSDREESLPGIQQSTVCIQVSSVEGSGTLQT
jgi:hypothetical protein